MGEETQQFLQMVKWIISEYLCTLNYRIEIIIVSYLFVHLIKIVAHLNEKNEEEYAVIEWLFY